MNVQGWINCVYERIPHRDMSVFCVRTQKTSTSLLKICVYAQIIQCWKTLLSKIIIRNFCACTQKSSTSLLRICVYAQKIQQIIIIKSSNNPIVDVLRSAQKLQVWNTYIPVFSPKSLSVKLLSTLLRN